MAFRAYTLNPPAKITWRRPCREGSYHTQLVINRVSDEIISKVGPGESIVSLWPSGEYLDLHLNTSSLTAWRNDLHKITPHVMSGLRGVFLSLAETPESIDVPFLTVFLSNIISIKHGIVKTAKNRAHAHPCWRDRRRNLKFIANVLLGNDIRHYVRNILDRPSTNQALLVRQRQPTFTKSRAPAVYW